MSRKPERGPRRLCGPGVPCNLLGGALVALFTFKLFTTNPFDPVTTLRRDDPLERRARGTFVEVSKRSHAYLQGRLWDRHPGSYTANVSARYEPSSPQEAQQLSQERSVYLDLIRQDLLPWKDSGITHELVEGASMMYDDCDGDMLRFQVINGSLWVQHITERLEGGWYPAPIGPGNAAAKGRIPFAVLALLETLRAFPGQVPDVDAVLHTADFPCIPGGPRQDGAPPLPILGLQGSRRHADIPFPDYTYWGNEHQYLQDPWGSPVQGWGNQAELLARKYENVSLLDRIPQASWRGRTKDERYPERDHIRRVFVGCVEELKAAGRPADAALLNVLQPPLALQDTCDYRYSVYIESGAYASNLKQKLACGSLLLALRIDHWEFYSRLLRPGLEYVEVDDAEEGLCERVVNITRDLNAAFGSRLGQQALASRGELTPTLALQLKQLKRMRRDPLLSALLDGAGVAAGRRRRRAGEQLPAAPVPGAGGNYSWGSPLLPWEIAANGQRFVLQAVRMRDVLLYIRDLLRAYSALQRHPIRPSWNRHSRAACYTGARLLAEFGTPHGEDAAIIEAAYPWLRRHTGGCQQDQEAAAEEPHSP